MIIPRGSLSKSPKHEEEKLRMEWKLLPTSIKEKEPLWFSP